MAASRKANTTARGLGFAHRQNREALLRRHTDGNPCWWCGRSMFKHGPRNWDHRPLAADHSISRAMGGTKADRLLHATCNERRGDGSKDHLRPVAVQQPPAEPDHLADGLTPLLMAWP